ncbi:MAG: MATE family efflux transporter [Phycisphaeraceae bacterium]|nr:MATE family efflux transporter [Phycisphaeraceae bacterium]
MNDDAGESPAPPPPPKPGGIKAGKLAGLSMWAAIWVLAWPILTESMLNALVGLVDTTLSAGISEAATDAISVGSYVIWFLGMIALAIGVGSTALIARSVGAGKLAVANAAVGQSILLATFIGVIVGVLLGTLAGPIAALMSLDGESAPLFIQYMRILAITVPVMTVGMVGGACLRGAGDSIRPLVMMAVVNLVNIVFSWVFSGVDIATASLDESGEIVRRIVLENPFSFDMGIRGIAIGTLAAWTTGALFVIWLLFRGRAGVTLMRRRLRIHAVTMRRLVRVALPNFIESLGMWTGNFITILFVGWMGVAGLFGAHLVAIRIEAISFTPGFAMGLASATLTGQYLGAGDPDQARLAMRRCAMISSCIMGFFGILFLLIPGWIVGLLTQQPTHLEYAPKLLFVCGWIQIPFAIGLTIRNTLRGAGDTKFVALITWISNYGIRLPLAWILCGVDIPLGTWGVIPNPNPYDWGLVGLWVGLCTEHIFRATFYTLRYLNGAWTRIRV